MRRRVIAAALAVCAASLLAGCTALPSTPDRFPIFERNQTESDAFPLTLPDTYDPESIRFVGVDSTGDRYWVGRSGTGYCILWRAASGADWVGACGGLPLSGGAQGVRFEFADAPAQLSPEEDERVGDTLLVQRS